MDLPDIQKTIDTRNIYIQQAGICNLIVPVTIKIKDSSELCNTVATIQATTDVNPKVKGINMSRLSRRKFT